MSNQLVEIAKSIIVAGEADIRTFHQLYDQFVWLIATAPKDELKEFAQLLFSEPYSNIPIPLQMSVFRLLGLEFLGIEELREIALAGIEMYCDPVEQENASETIRKA